MGVRLCIGDYAGEGYEPAYMGVKVFSVEELCYFIGENACLLDESIQEEGLILWLQKECGLPSLAEELKKSLRKKASLKVFVDIILEYTGFYDKAEKTEILQAITENSTLTVYEKRKAKADALLNKGQYGLAGREYAGLLEQLPEEEKILRGQIYHACGVSLARLFYFELAGEYFWKAYALTGQTSSYEQYLWTRRLTMSEQEYIDFLKEHEEAYEDSLVMEDKLEELRESWHDSREAGLLAAIGEAGKRGDSLSRQKLSSRVDYLKDAYREMIYQPR